MRIIPKSEVVPFLTLDTMTKLHKYQGKLKMFEKKYKSTFKQFEKKIKLSKNESFEEWDDYIEWKAFYHLNENLNSKLKDLKNGHFKVA